MKPVPFFLAGTLLACMLTTAVAADYGPTMGKHDMTGTVEKIDRGKGTVELKTDAGTLHLRFPPASVRNVRKGDTLNVNLSFSKKEEPERRRPGAMFPGGER